MAAMEFHQGRLIDHVHLSVRDIEAVFHGPTRRNVESVLVSPDP